jgi:nucleoside-diphosphate-sugar epimerase
MSEKRKAVITGGAGFIGSHIADVLIGEGFQVELVDNLHSGKVENVNSKARFHKLDIRDLEPLKKVFNRAELVFHTAAVPRVQYSIEHPVETSSINIMGTVNVLVAAHEGGVKKVIYSASSSAYGDQPTTPLHENMPPLPKSPYGLQKYTGELLCRTWNEVYGLETVSLRYFNVYGPRLDPDGDYALVIGKFLKQRKEGNPMTITGDGTQTRDFTHVKDVVRANLLAASSLQVGKGEVINIGAGRNVSVNKLAELIGGPVEHIAPRLEPHDTLADNGLAKRALGWVPEIYIEEGLEELKKLYL